jgi:hypothetical protein
MWIDELLSFGLGSNMQLQWYAKARQIFEQSEDQLLTYEIDLNRNYLHGRQGRILEALAGTKKPFVPTAVRSR